MEKIRRQLKLMPEGYGLNTATQFSSMYQGSKEKRIRIKFYLYYFT